MINFFLFFFFTAAAAESHLRLLSTVAQAVKGQGTICWVDCGYVQGTGHCGWRAGVRGALMGGVGNGSDWHSGKEDLMERLLQEEGRRGSRRTGRLCSC